MTDAIVLRCQALKKSYTEAGTPLEVLKGIDFTVSAGERISIVGASGSGKSTLLHLLGGLDIPTEGHVEILGQDLSQLSDADRGLQRNKAMGFVYQFHHLLPEFTALENVAMPLLVRRTPTREASDAATKLLQEVDLGERLHHKPAELSGGERQRAAVARALITRPAVVLADEPTGNLDGKTGDKVFELMLALNQSYQTSLIVVTHDPSIAERMDRKLVLANGLLLEQ